MCVPKSVEAWALGWMSLGPTPECKRAWTTLFFATVWTIWEFRNRKVFEEVEPVTSLALDTIQFRVAWWFTHHGIGSSDPLTTLIQNLCEFCRDPVIVRRYGSGVCVPPGVGFLKFNVDGSVIGQTGMAGIGGIFRYVLVPRML